MSNNNLIYIIDSQVAKDFSRGGIIIFMFADYVNNFRKADKINIIISKAASAPFPHIIISYSTVRVLLVNNIL